ncbi:Lztr1 [Symbiodinium natans]|uniref:Lztr1 protein n=1 Tax=Symbiodinium natans TaxID=878477 RepID=A0A812QG97_9DINO|nr:Lztr1 [Symbiodinium natans]
MLLTMSGCVIQKILLLALFAVDTAQASSWTQLTPSGTAPSSRHAFGMVWSQGYDSVYIFGGRENDGVGRLNDLYRYSSSANNWTLLSPGGSPPTGRSSFGIASDDANDLFYVFGGEGVTVGSDLHQYNIAGNSWTQPTSSGSTPSLRRGHGMVWSHSDDSIYIFGGYYSSSWTLMNDLYRYDTSASHWTTLNPGGSLPTGRGFLAMASCNSSLYVFGGHGSSIPLSDFYRYDILANDWTELSPTGSQPSRRYGHSMACREMDISLYVFGGHDGGPQEMLNDFYRYDVVANEWTMLSAAGSAAAASARRGERGVREAAEC